MCWGICLIDKECFVISELSVLDEEEGIQKFTSGIRSVHEVSTQMGTVPDRQVRVAVFPKSGD